MKTQMKKLELWCNEYRERWNKKYLWSEYCIIGDAYISGYRKACEQLNYNGMTVNVDPGQEVIEVEIASPQIGQNDDPS